MSISKVQMKLGNVWEYGQAYVGIIRSSVACQHDHFVPY